MKTPKYNSVGFKDSFIDKSKTREERKEERQERREQRREDWKNRNKLVSYKVGENEQGNDIIRVTTNKAKRRAEAKKEREARRKSRKEDNSKGKGKRIKQKRKIVAKF
ncbi:MAG: hypothetical protein ACTSQK_10520 [Candidatus Heimdallarchaeota archaeon]